MTVKKHARISVLTFTIILFFLNLFFSIHLFAEPHFKIHFINVGMGEGILVEYIHKNLTRGTGEQRYMVIDGGSKSTTHSCSAQASLKPKDKTAYVNYIKTIIANNFSNNQEHIAINELVITHPHEDHYNYLTALINDEEITINKIYYGGFLNDTVAITINSKTEDKTRYRMSNINFYPDALATLIKNKKIYKKSLVSDEGTKFFISSDYGTNIYQIAGPINFKSNPNDLSVIFKIIDFSNNLNNAAIYLTADATGDVVDNKDASQWYSASAIQVLKLAHHGSDTHGSNSTDLFNKTSPNIAIISSGIFPQFSLPKCNRICGNDAYYSHDGYNIDEGLLFNDISDKSLFTLKNNTIDCYYHDEEEFNSNSQNNSKCTKITKVDIGKNKLYRTTIQKAIFSTCTHGTIVLSFPVKDQARIELPDMGEEYICKKEDGVCKKIMKRKQDDDGEGESTADLTRTKRQKNKNSMEDDNLKKEDNSKKDDEPMEGNDLNEDDNSKNIDKSMKQ
jgi:hypothetical protein